MADPVDPHLLQTLEIARRRLAAREQRIPGWQVHAHFLRLEEIRQREGDIDKERVFRLLQQMRAGETV
jgi:hypothetical protein